MRQTINTNSKYARRTRSFHNALDPGVALITTEALVAAVARQRARHLPTCHFGQHVGWQFRGVSERLVKDFRNARNELECVLRREIQLVVIGSEVAGHSERMVRFIVALDV